MIRSMTGYGREEGRHRGRLLVAELRSVNHRHCDVLVKLPRQLAPLEDRLKKKIQETCGRGHIEVTVTLNGVTSVARQLSLDRSAARQYYQILKELRGALSLPGEITLSMLAGFRDVITVSEEDEKAEAIFPALSRVVDRAVSRLDRMRKEEGSAIGHDLLKRVATIEGAVDRIEAREVFVLEAYRKRLSQRVAELSGGIPLDPLRLSQEVALFADRSDISEERVRLRTHLEQFRKLLRSDSPVGRTLDFLLQEIHRETNTIGSKANDAKISLEVVGIKTELEKIREQVQNVL
jgi:uncharacterized protein (TIGR00255 family)